MEEKSVARNTLAFVHEFLRQTVKKGDFCIDATAGKGRDTALLCSLVGKTGRVLAFDIQAEAVRQTKALLAEKRLTAEVFCDSHENMGQYAQTESVDAIVFNFGRLPGGDPKLVTKASSSLKAIETGLGLLKKGGVMAMALYYGKENGYGERDEILRCLATLDDKAYSVFQGNWPNRRHDPPLPIFIWKE